MKIGIYNRYWGTMGGGEKHVGTIAESLLGAGHEVDLIRVAPLDEQEFCSRMNLNLTHARWIDWPGESCEALAPRTAQYDVFINSTYCSSMVSQAKRSMYLVFFPHEVSENTLSARALQRVADRLEGRGWLRAYRLVSRAKRLFRDRRGKKARQFLGSYQLIIANSEFTASWVRRRWGRDAVVLAPPIDVGRYRPAADNQRGKTILSVGRFFAGGHNKKHLEMLVVFRTMHDAGHIPAGWEYHLVGSVHSETAEHRDYYERVQELALGYPIKILGNLSAELLLKEYRGASIFWHGAGWGEDESSQPERMEHFGMTTCEAMAAGAIPVVMPLGGPREIVRHGVNGFHFRDADELSRFTSQLITMHGSDDLESLSRRAMSDIEQYSTAQFNRRFIAEFNSNIRI